MWNVGLDESQAAIKIAGRTINNLRYADNTTLLAESKEELKSLLIRVKEESEWSGLKLNIQKTKMMASSPSVHGISQARILEWVAISSSRKILYKSIQR